MKTTILIIAVLALACGGFAQESKQNPNPKEAIENLMRQAREAKEAGRTDEAAKLHNKAEQMMAELRGKEPDKKPEKFEGKDKPAPGKDFIKKGDGPEGKGKDKSFLGKGPEAERLQHVMQAVEHLNAAGLHEPAKSIEQIAQNMRRELEEQMKHRQALEQGGEGKKGEAKPHAELQEMQNQIRKMAEMIEHLQAELKKRGS